MDKTKGIAGVSGSLRIFNAAHSGYRRAGLVLAKGENLLQADQLSEAQLAQLQSDQRLSLEPVTNESAIVNANPQGAMDDAPLGLAHSDVLKLAGCPDELAPIVALIAVVDADGSLVLTSSNKPDIKALEALGLEDLDGEQVPLNISAAQRDAAWDWYQQLKSSPVTAQE